MHLRYTPVAAALCAAFSLSTAIAEEAPRSLGSVVVTAARQAQRADEVLADISVIESEEIRNAGPNQTINDLLARQPGIEITRQGAPGTAAGVMIRGSNNTHALVLVDGMRLGSTTTGSANWGFIPLEQVDRIEIIRGSCSSLYGSDAIGGVIQIFTKRGEGPLQMFAEAGYGSWNTRSTSAGFSGASHGWRYNFQLGYKASDGYSAIRNPLAGTFNPDKDGYQMTTSSGGLSYAFNKDHELGLAYLYSDGWNRYDGSRTADTKQSQRIYGANVYSKNRLTSGWTSTLKLGQSADHGEDYNNGNRTSLIESKQTQYQWQNDIDLAIGSALLAVERTEQTVSGSVNYAVKDRSINSYLAGWQGKYEAHRAQINVRRDDNSQFGGKTTGSLAYGYQFNTNWRANGTVSTGFKAPSFNDLYWPGSGNPNLKPEESRNRELTVHYQQGLQHASLTYYHNKVDNLIAWAPGPSGLWLPSNIDKAKLTGWTLAYDGKIGEYRANASLDLQDPIDATTQKLLRYRAKQIFKAGLDREFGNFSAGAEFLASSERYNDVANSVRLGGYALVNLNAAYRLDREWSVFARANNIFNRQYEQVRDYATPLANFFVGIRYTPQ